MISIGTSNKLNVKKEIVASVFLTMLFVMPLIKRYVPSVIGVDTTMLVSFICIGLSLVTNKGFKLIINVPVTLWFSLLTAYGLSFLYTVSSVYSVYKARELFLIITITVVSTISIIRSVKALKTVFFMFVLIGVLLSVSAISNYTTTLVTTNAYGFDYLVYSRFSLLSYILLEFYFSKEHDKNRLIKYAMLSIKCICALAVVISGSASTTLTFLIILLYGYVFSRRIALAKKIFLSMLAIALVYLIYRFGLMKIFLYKLSVYKEIGFGGGRINYIETGMEMILNRPILGYGIGSFPIVFNGIDAVNYPHNTIIEVGCEVGIIGMGLYIGIIFCSIGEWKKKGHRLIGSIATMNDIFLPLLIYAFMLIMTSSLGNGRLLYFILALPFLRMVEDREQ